MCTVGVSGSGIGGGGPKSPPESAVYMNQGPQKKLSLDTLVRDVDINAMIKLLLPLVFLCVSLTCFGQLSPEQIKEIRQAAEHGKAVDQNALGLMYNRGIGVAQDQAEAVKWYRMAAEQGFAQAQWNLGLMYQYGEGIPEDDAEAVKWHRLAAEQGFAKAQCNLGLRCFIGEGVPEDHIVSYMWFNLSAAQGNEIAKKNKERISKVMTRDQIAEAQKLSREWFAKRKK